MDTTQLVTSIILAIVTLLAGVLTRYAGAWITANVSVANQDLLSKIAVVAVHAAEQLGDIGQVADKKAWAVAQVDAWLKSVGLAVTAEQVSAAIEAAVHAELHPVAPSVPLLPPGTTQTTVRVAPSPVVTTSAKPATP
jgi:hypothetical protein